MKVSKKATIRQTAKVFNMPKKIKEEIENNLFDDEEFCLSDYTKIFVNEMRFSKPRQMDFDEKEDYIDILSKIYMKFDVKKDKRLNSDEEKIYIKRILLQSNIELLPPNIKGQFEEDIKFDYLSNKFAIKLFSFKDKDIKRMIPTAKQWSFTANELKNKYQVVFIYDQCEIQEQEPEANIVLNILKENAKVCEKSAGLEYITQ